MFRRGEAIFRTRGRKIREKGEKEQVLRGEEKVRWRRDSEKMRGTGRARKA